MIQNKCTFFGRVYVEYWGYIGDGCVGILALFFFVTFLHVPAYVLRCWYHFKKIHFLGEEKIG